MSDTARRNARNRARGKTWERTIEVEGRKLGFDIDRTRDTGTHDQGDLALRYLGKTIVIEAKNAAFQPGPFVEEAILEATNYANKRNSPTLPHAVVFVKRRGKGGLEEHFALTTVGEYLRLVSAT